jgi:hypothetical protein
VPELEDPEVPELEDPIEVEPKEPDELELEYVFEPQSPPPPPNAQRSPSRALLGVKAEHVHATTVARQRRRLLRKLAASGSNYDSEKYAQYL